MELLKKAIMERGRAIGTDIIQVDMFLNHQIDIELLNEIGREFYRIFEKVPINKILTIEASGIGIACITAQYFHVPVVFAKKGQARNIGNNVYSCMVHSFTKNATYPVQISKDYIGPGDNLLIIDDFLANGQAILGLKDIADQAGAVISGVGIVIEKGFQGGGQLLRDKGLRVESLAIVDVIENGTFQFRE